MQQLPTVIFIGAGNLATQTALALKEKNIPILQIYSRTEESAKSLADKCDCNFTTNIQEISNQADIYIYAVKDDVLPELIENNPIKTGLHVHTAGSVSIDIIKGKKDNFGVFYPLQTFSKSKRVKFDNIPIFVEANSEVNLSKLKKLGECLSNNVIECDSTQRQSLHLAAVFSCNFTNHLYSIAADILEKNQLSFEYILPLIKETVNKLDVLTPNEAQTGPAVRYDTTVIDKHLKALSKMPEEQHIYELLSKRIYEAKK